jgi:predicted secreted protein
MKVRLFLIMACVFFFALPPALDAGEKEQFKFRSDPEIRQVRPGKPVRVELKRNPSGKYSWEISGDSVEKVIEADRELREYLKIRDKK